MSKLQILRVLVNERLTAAAEEIFVLFERTIAEYQEELCRSQQENQRKQRLLNESNPRILQPRSGAGVHIPSPSPPGPGLNQDIIKTVQIKEETEEHSVKQEEEQLPEFVPESIIVCVKTEDPQIQTEHKEETHEEDISSEPHLHSETDGDTELSSDADNDDNWKPHIRPEDAQIKNQVQTTDQAAQNAGPSSEYKPVPETSASVTGFDEGYGGKKHQCPVCNKTFLSNSSLQIHSRVHTGERPYGCSMCDKTFNQKGHLQRHRKTHTGEKPFSCSFCNKRFTLRCSRETHMRIHTGETPYSCSLCTKKFAYSSALRTHMRTHTGERPHSCSFCNKKFTQSSSLRKHMRTHTGERPYSCLVCDKRFTQSCSLRKHMRTHTNISQTSTEGD